MEHPMKKFVSAMLASSMALSATSAYAGGPVIAEADDEVEVVKPASSAGILPLLLIPIILCVALCGGDNDEPAGDDDDDDDDDQLD
jgi:hypothetical protein